MAASKTTTTPTSVSQLVYTHRKIRDLARGTLPDRVTDELHNTACAIEHLVVDTPSVNWSEFGAKARLLFDEMTDAPTASWLESIRASIRTDIKRLDSSHNAA